MNAGISATAARRAWYIACGAIALSLATLAPAFAASPINVQPGTYDAYQLGGQDLPHLGQRDVSFDRQRRFKLTIRDDDGVVTGPLTLVLFYVCVTSDGRHWNEYHVLLPAPLGQPRRRLDVAIGYDHPGDSFGYDVFTRDTGTTRWTTQEYWQPRQ